MMLESLQFLRKRGNLPPLWLAFENNFIKKWESTDLFAKWEWKSDDERTLFDIWSEKLRQRCGLKKIVEQSELLEDELNSILSRQKPPTEAMLNELDLEHVHSKEKILSQLYNY